MEVIKRIETWRGSTNFFDGGLGECIGWKVLGFIVTFFTIGICYPWALCKVYGWKINHTVIDGQRLEFQGRAINLFKHWLKWWFFAFITFGFYNFWIFIKLEDWKVKNTIFK
ncbi:hypothetical protein KJG39_002547 [Listeria monocytogenes]|nr:hypothetical protein [Listeria monocytogenes]